MIAWRITTRDRKADAFDGKGASKFGGRWNGKGTRVVYASESRALAVLEQLVHVLPPQMSKPYFLFRVDVPDDSIETHDVGSLPPSWADHPADPSLSMIGTNWAASGRSLALVVPSAVMSEEKNILLNPDHERWAEVRISSPIEYRFDRRFLKVAP